VTPDRDGAAGFLPAMRHLVWFLASVCLPLAACSATSTLTVHSNTPTTVAISTTVSTTTSTAATTSTTTTVPRPAVPELPVVACKTTFPFPRTPTKLPAYEKTKVPATLASQLAVYEDTVPITAVVAPRNWDCTAVYGGNGEGGITVFPPDEATASGAPFAQLAVGVVTFETSACLDCALHQACELFSAADSELQSEYQDTCPTPPVGQEETQLSQTSVSFIDPPGVQGVGNPSGGANPAIGLLTYAPDSHNGSYLETCTLPAADQQICEASVATFNATYGSQ
jgi:hypothetical protein